MRMLGASPVQTWTFLIVGMSFALYVCIAWLSRVRDTKGFYVAGRGVPTMANGMATGADWMSAASFISMAGLISTMGFAGGVYLMGWTGGFVLIALLLAPYLRKFGRFTVPDFIGDRYDSNTARMVAVICAIFISFTYVAGQMKGVGVVFSRFLEVRLEVGVLIGILIVFIYATLGGMKGITWTQVAQYWVLMTAFLVPAIAISIKLTGSPIPQVGMGGTLLPQVDPVQPYLLEKLNQINHDFGFSSYTDAYINPKWDKLNVFCLALALMAGTAGLPHVIIRFYTARSVKAARWSAFWTLLFIAVLYLTAPATAAFTRYYMLDSTAGLNGRSAEDLPGWYHSWHKSGLLAWLDFNGDGRVQMHNDPSINEIYKVDGVRDPGVANAIREYPDQWIADYGGDAARKKLIEAGGISQPDKDIFVLATPEMAGLADWMIALVAAGGLAAALSTASGLLLVISSSVAHDLYYRVVNPNASEKMRLLVGRVAIGLAVIIAGYFGVNPPGFVGEVVAFAFGLAAASFFPAIVLGIFSKRVGTMPAVIGMIVGIGFTAFYIFTQTAANIVGPDLADTLLGPTMYADGSANTLRTKWFFGINAQGIGTIGMLLNFVVTLALTPLFSAPSKAVQDLVDSIREPHGAGPAVEIEAVVER